MPSSGIKRAWLRLPSCLLLLSLLTASVLAADRPLPKVSRTEVEYQPTDLQYFADSETVLVTDDHGFGFGSVTISKDEGKTWKPIPDIDGAHVVKVQMNPHDNKMAIALGAEKKHYITKDQGETWKSFVTQLHPNFAGGAVFSFHATQPNHIIMNMRDPSGPAAGERTLYTLDAFATHKVLREKTVHCIWAREQTLMQESDPNTDPNRVLCIAEGKYSARTDDWRLVVSDDYFDEHEVEPALEDERAVTGIASVVSVKGYILAARNSEGTDEMALYVTKDAETWHRAQFGQHKLKEGGYTIMESTNYSLQVDVLMPESSEGNPMGMLYTSNYEGQYFTRNEEYTNRNRYGFVDFEKVSSIQGIVLTNIVANWEAVRDAGAAKKLHSKISFDDGRTFHDMKVGDDTLHLQSVTSQRNAGRVFSSPSPGLLMGIGNTGSSLLDYNDGDLYVSEDAGATWHHALPGAHKYEFGDQGGIMLAMYDEGPIDKMIYSLHFGRDDTWNQFYFKDDFDLPGEVRPQLLTTLPDSTSLKFIMVGTIGRLPDVKHYIYSIDFSGMNLPKCGKSDFITFNARTDKDGEPTCIMGHKQAFRRRKAEAKCFTEEYLHEPLPMNDHSGCTCQDIDYECDIGFVRSEDRKECLPTSPIVPPKGACEKANEDFDGPSGFRRIPGNDCIVAGGVDKTKTIKRPCSATSRNPASGEITREITTFPASTFIEYYYLEKSGVSEDKDETVIVLTDEREVFITKDHGKSWEQKLKGEDIVAIYPNRHFNDNVYFVTPSTTVHYSKNRGDTLHSFKAPGRPNTARMQILRFHQTEQDWLIWTTCAESNDIASVCQPVAHATTKHGDEWKVLMRSIDNCEYVYRNGRPTSEKLIYCSHFVNEDTHGPKELVGSEDFFETKNVYFKDMLNFATMAEYIVVAAKEENSQYLKVDSSVDGKTFADAKFPPNLKVPHQTAYTVLDSSTHEIFLHVTVNGIRDEEYGSLIKSNSNGTSYVLSLNGVNRNANGYVDFEKMMSLEGVAIANIVSNLDDVDQGSTKKIKTMITHNDGAQWALIMPPEKDAEGKKYECAGKHLEECSLHLHGYTEREDARDTYSSASASGLMIGIGNVGPNLRPKREGNTFVSRDGGVTWHTAKNGQYMWEYGDQGSLIVIVEQTAPTSVVYYSRDEGQRWTEYKFSDTPIQIRDISTVPSDTSRNFLLWGRENSGSGKALTVNIDFSGLTSRQCHLGEPGDSDNDYELWEPKHPAQENNCLFGHVAQYWRKKISADCYNGPLLPADPYSIRENCSCTVQDYECDFNYERLPDNTCHLVSGLLPKDPLEQCSATPNLLEYHEITGYRKLPLSTCEGGKQLEGQVMPCPGHEEEYRQKHGISGAGLFFAIVIPILVALGVGYWVYTRMEGRFGRIRLGGGEGVLGATSGGGGGVGQSPFVKYPVAAIAGIAAVAMATPRIVGGGVRFLRERFGRRGAAAGRSAYTTRGSFARGPGYSAVGTGDEGELLGDDSDDEI